MGQIGRVEKIKGENLLVKVVREEACAHCKMCTTGINEGKECLIEAVNNCDAKVGDTVKIDVKENYFLRATSIMYGIPLIVMVLSIGISLAILEARGYSNAEIISSFIGLVFTAIVYILINKREKNNKNEKYLPTAVSKIEK